MIRRRVIFWCLVAMVLLARIMIQFPRLQYIIIHGRVVGGSSLPWTLLGTTIAILLLWCVIYLRVEPLLVRLTLLFIAIPLCWQSAVEIWHLIIFYARPQP